MNQTMDDSSGASVTSSRQADSANERLPSGLIQSLSEQTVCSVSIIPALPKVVMDSNNDSSQTLVWCSNKNNNDPPLPNIEKRHSFNRSSIAATEIQTRLSIWTSNFNDAIGMCFRTPIVAAVTANDCPIVMNPFDHPTSWYC